MDDFTAKIQSKKMKVENALSELNKEILALFSVLQRLKNHSLEIVRDLNSITVPAIYFKEFMDVNSFILKYLSLLTEMNCRFEMLEINEKKQNNSISTTHSTTTSETLSEIHDTSVLQFDSSRSLMNVDAKDKMQCHFESDDSFLNLKSEVENLRNDKSKELENVQCEVENRKNNNTNNLQVTSAKSKSNLQENSDKTQENSDLICFGTKFSPDIEIDNYELRVGKTDRIICGSLSKGTSVSRVPSSYVGCITQTDEKELQTVNGTLSALIDSTYALTCSEVQTQGNKINFPHGDIPVAEVVPRMMNKYGCNLETAVNSLQRQNERKLIIPAQRISEENSNEEHEIQPIRISRKVGNEYEVIIEHIQSPSEFYIYFKDIQANLFAELMQKLKLIGGVKKKVWNKTSESKKVWLSNELGSYVLYYSKCDELWCRAKVINWYLNYKDDLVKIFLLDYGESKCVSIDDLESMPEYFKKFPTFLRRCHLYGILPSDLEISDETLSWGKESISEMKSLTETSKILKIKIAPGDDLHPGESLPVYLLDENNDCINELLVKSKCALHSSQLCPASIKSKKKEALASDVSLEHWNPMREDFQAYENSYDLDIEDPATYIYGYVGKDYERVCRHFAKSGFCFKGAACKKEHKKLDPLGFTTDQEEVYKNAFNNLPVPPLSTIVRVQVTCLLAVNNFCCLLENHQYSPEEESLQTLLNFMNSNENVQEMKKLLIPPSAGQIVIAQYCQDKSWYRAKILESQPEKDIYLVLYVDYGNKEEITLAQIRAIEPRYLHLPFQAMNCYIFGIRENPEVPVKDAMFFLSTKLSNGQVNIEIVSKLPGEDVSLLVHIFDKNGTNIGADLLAHNYAIPKEEMLISCDSESIPG